MIYPSLRKCQIFHLLGANISLAFSHSNVRLEKNNLLPMQKNAEINGNKIEIASKSVIECILSLQS